MRKVTDLEIYLSNPKQNQGIDRNITFDYSKERWRNKTKKKKEKKKENLFFLWLSIENAFTRTRGKHNLLNEIMAWNCTDEDLIWVWETTEDIALPLLMVFVSFSSAGTRSTPPPTKWMLEGAKSAPAEPLVWLCILRLGSTDTSWQLSFPISSYLPVTGTDVTLEKL